MTAMDKEARKRYLQKEALRRARMRVKLACFVGVLQAVVTGGLALVMWRIDQPWLVNAVVALLLAGLALGVYYSLPAAAIGLVVLAGISGALQVLAHQWIGVVIAVAFLLAYVDGTRSLLLWRRLERASEKPPAGSES